MASVQVTAVNSYGFLGYAVILSIISVFAVDGSSENIFSQGCLLYTSDAADEL